MTVPIGISIPPIKRRVFVSYHHGGDQAYYNYFSAIFHDGYEAIYDNSLERSIDSDNVDYVMRRIRENFITGTSCTIVLCGAQTPWRKYVDWEIAATLDAEHALIGVQLPTATLNASGLIVVPDRLHDNISSGYASWIGWDLLVQRPSEFGTIIEGSTQHLKSLIRNHRQRRVRNG
jgi:hypothetical protein